MFLLQGFHAHFLLLCDFEPCLMKLFHEFLHSGGCGSVGGEEPTPIVWNVQIRLLGFVSLAFSNRSIISLKGLGQTWKGLFFPVNDCHVVANETCPYILRGLVNNISYSLPLTVARRKKIIFLGKDKMLGNVFLFSAIISVDDLVKTYCTIFTHTLTANTLVPVRLDSARVPQWLFIFLFIIRPPCRIHFLPHLISWFQLLLFGLGLLFQPSYILLLILPLQFLHFFLRLLLVLNLDFVLNLPYLPLFLHYGHSDCRFLVCLCLHPQFFHFLVVPFFKLLYLQFVFLPLCFVPK
mmetsp:Transcript_6984/g.10701  ORF Transcript_6984/g.10701 Transcript_6984/m.10701 type:complete len:294 (+) Transcript_6984:708-1589(+)